MESQLPDDVQAALSSSGSAHVAVEDLTVPIESWRHAARAAARKLGRPVMTFVTGKYVTATLVDWPRNDSERAEHQKQMRAALNTAAPSDHQTGAHAEVHTLASGESIRVGCDCAIGQDHERPR